MPAPCTHTHSNKDNSAKNHAKNTIRIQRLSIHPFKMFMGFFSSLLLFCCCFFTRWPWWCCCFIKFCNCHFMRRTHTHTKYIHTHTKYFKRVPRKKNTYHFILMAFHLKLFIIWIFTRNKRKTNFHFGKIEWSYQSLPAVRRHTLILHTLVYRNESVFLGVEDGRIFISRIKKWQCDKIQ